MKTITLNITVDEANIILDALGQQPFVKVYSLIGKIQQQASEQVNDAELTAQPQAMEKRGD